MQRVIARRRVIAWQRLGAQIDALRAASPVPAEPAPIAQVDVVAIVGVTVRAVLTVLHPAPVPAPMPAAPRVARPSRPRPAVLIDLSSAPSDMERRAAGWTTP